MTIIDLGVDSDASNFEIDAVPAVKNFLLNHKNVIDSALAIGNVSLHTVLDYEPLNIDVGMFPLITLGEVSFQKAWIAAPYTIEVRYELPINGYLLHDDNPRNARCIRAFLAAVSHLFEDPKHQEIEIPNRTYTIHYHSEPPLDSGEVDYALIGDAFLRSFKATWHGYVTRNTHFQEG